MMPIKPRIIGITGGVGAGKSEVLSYIKQNYHCEILLTDDLAKKLQNPGERCYAPLLEILGNEVLQEDGFIHKGKMAEVIFSDGEKLKQVNALIHPAVKQVVKEQIARVKEEKVLDFYFVEAALLIEEGFDTICDELWYIYAKEEVRRERLQTSRGYSQEKITSIIKKQLPEQAFREACKVVIDNSGAIADTKKQIDQVLEAYLWQE